MKIKKAIGLAISLAILPASSFFTFTSCEDYLTITPTNIIVEEEFWQDKNDLNNALFGCYKSMTEGDFLKRVIYWGEMRSDNCDASTELKTSDEEYNIMNANILPTYGIYDWTPMYKTINYCNKILAHGPEVVKTDESFSEENWKPVKAEVTAIRALCYFYLVRAFGEVPYITEDINNNSQQLSHHQTTQLAVLDSIIADLDSVKLIAMTEYGNNVANKGRITKKAIYALLADAYLWRASYLQGNCHPFVNREENEYAADPITTNPTDNAQAYSTAEEDYKKCIEHCDAVIKMCYDDLNKKLKQRYSGLVTVQPVLDDLLSQNDPFTKLGTFVNLSSSSSSLRVNAFSEIFGDGNSAESIFEIQFDGINTNNSMTKELYWNLKDNKVARLTAPKTMFADVASNPNEEIASAIFTKTDYRRWEALRRDTKEDGQTQFDYDKYAKSYWSFTNGTKGILTDNSKANKEYSWSQSLRSDVVNDANFIVYRLPEILLMKAEAMSQIYASEEDSLMKAFNYVKTVFRRSNPYAYDKSNTTAGTDSLKTKNFLNQRQMEYLVMAERQREFLCEGKRWFDLVRFAQRRGNTKDMLSLLIRKYSGNQKAIQAKLADMQSLFSPVYDNELKANYLLYQNGVWKTSKTTGRTDNRK